MKDAEDEAFDELAKRQGHWGGGYQAKKAMAADKFCDANCVWTNHHPDCNMVADKINFDFDEEYQKNSAVLAKYRTAAQPAQEPDALTIAYQSGYYDGKKAALAQPVQEQWNAALDEAAARIGEIKGFGQATQDSFAVYIKGLKK